MAESLFSPSWYRVAGLTPRLRGHTRVYHHDYRGESWYVLQDQASGRYYRFSPEAYRLIGLMDGERTVQELWDAATEYLGDDAPTQPEVVQLLSQLHSADVLLCNVPPDTAELLKRSEKVRRTKWRQNLRSPMALRFPLLDPERFLARTVRFVRPLFTVWGAALWLVVVASAAVLAGMHWPELTEDVTDRVLSAQNLVALWFIYPALKALHELGHGYAVKTWGGEVHEMGIMLLVLMPIPYVDASAASEFRSKNRRVVVGAAGIFVELFVAALAMFLWVNLEPGVLRSMAYNTLIVAGVSTLLFNGNPLLRYDGYYVLADLLEIPNMGQRGQKYLGYLVQRYAFRAKDVKPPRTGPGERFWFVTYTVAAFVYRIFVYVAIVLFIAGKFFFIGILLAAWAAFSMVAMPLYKGVKFLVSSPVLREKRPRAILLSGIALAVILVLLFAVPLPNRTRCEGVVWIPEEALVRAGAAGFVSRVVVEPGTRVATGDLLVEGSDPLLAANVEVYRARVEELRARYDAALATDQVQVRILEEELASARAQLEDAEERLTDLDIRSPTAGVFVLPRAQDLPGRWVQQGDLVGYVLEVRHPTVRVVVPQSTVDLVRQRMQGVEVRLAERLDWIIPAEMQREVPGALEQLPSTILGSAGGGEIAIDPYDPEGTKALGKMFQFDIRLAQPIEDLLVGGRVYVRFDHGKDPLAFQAYRSVRQLFLRQFNV
ncbi:MAG: PqqD family peptide modification chaperone [bacterium]|nr:PqqD family peptide modification chaperone [bacterium]